MTVPVNLTQVIHTGNGIAIAFPYSFRLFAETDLQVCILNAVTDELISVLDPAEYSVTGADVTNYSGGFVYYTPTGGPLTDAYKIAIARTVDYIQGTSVPNQSAFLPRVVETQNDLIVMQIQQLADDVARSIKSPRFAGSIADAPIPSERANKIATYDADGNPQVIAVDDLIQDLDIPTVDNRVRTALGAISALRVTKLVSQSYASIADQTDPDDRRSVEGVSINAAADGESITIRSYGVITNALWSWTVDAPLFCGAAGVLTETPPTSGWLKQIAVATSSTTILVDLQPSILLA